MVPKSIFLCWWLCEHWRGQLRAIVMLLWMNAAKIPAVAARSSFAINYYRKSACCWFVFWMVAFAQCVIFLWFCSWKCYNCVESEICNIGTPTHATVVFTVFIWSCTRIQFFVCVCVWCCLVQLAEQLCNAARAISIESTHVSRHRTAEERPLAARGNSRRLYAILAWWRSRQCRQFEVRPTAGAVWWS